jgi:opacity protein-like surface antigen
MRLKLFPPASLAVLLILSAWPTHAQVAPAGVAKTLPLNVGVGFSNYNTDVSGDRLNGATLWLDYDPSWLPGRLYGLGIAAQGRDLNIGQPSNQPFLREDVGSGGAIYRWNRYFLVRPYGEILMGFGNADYLTPYGLHYHQTRTVTTAGGGAEFDAFHHLWVRADYEYEWWPNFYINGKSNPPKLDPQGITVGFVYHFSQGPSR